MAEQITLIQLEQHRASESPVEPAIPMERLKLRRPDRRQVTLRAIDVEQLVGADHPARAIWELSGQLDLSGFAGALRTQRDQGGRAAWDPRLLVAIWIWAYSEGISSAREIERQMDYRPELEWLCGMEVVNHHTLSDFRVCHAEALEQIFTQVLAVLSQAGLIDLEQVAADGTRLRSQGSTSSERRRGTIEKHLEQARAVVEELAAQAGDEESNQRRQAARRRAAREKAGRMEQALEQLRQVEASKRGEERVAAARVSENEPEARRQHESNGGWATGYNAQLATDAKEKIVVGVELTNNASDAQQLEPTLADMERRLGQKPRQVLADAGYNSRANLTTMQKARIEYATPARSPLGGSTAAARAAGIAAGFEAKFFIYDEAGDTYACPANKTLAYRRASSKRGRRYRQYQARSSDCLSCAYRLQCCPRSYQRGRTLSRGEEDALLARHRQWMESERAKAAYRRRSEVAEFPNAWLKERMGVRKFRVRGLRKARAELLWALLAYNIAQWIRLAWKPAARAAAAAA